MKNKYPTGKEVTPVLQKKIIELLRKYAGADNQGKFNSTLTAIALTDEGIKYVDEKYLDFFGEVTKKTCGGDYNPMYYPLCMIEYYTSRFPNKCLFNLKPEHLKKATTEIPTPYKIMTWFYKKHKNELIGFF